MQFVHHMASRSVGRYEAINLIIEAPLLHTTFHHSELALTRDDDQEVILLLSNKLVAQHVIHSRACSLGSQLYIGEEVDEHTSTIYLIRL